MRTELVTAVDAPGPGRREWIGLAVLTLANVAYALDLTALKLAIPAISADLRPGGAQLLWIIDISGFLVAGSLITMGTLGDRGGSSGHPRRCRCRGRRAARPARRGGPAGRPRSILQAMQVSSAIAAAVALGLAILAVVMLEAATR
jgi:MFS family permease